jgi:mRNA guanylyltransferase
MDAERTFEVELELKAEDCTQWIRLGDAEAAKKRTSEVAQDLWLRISAMMPCEETAGQLKEVKDAELEIAGQRACLAPFEKEGGATSGRSSNDFPGTMPVGFSKKHIEKVQREKYWVSEKTDGVRHFLVVVQLDKRSPTALLYDRKFKAWQMDGMEGLGEALGVGTVLDGEVVRNRSWKRDIFMVFDCMSVGGVSCVLEPFSNRLKRLEKDVMGQRYLKYLHEKQEQMNEKMKTLPVVLKLFKEITQGNNGVKEITRHIRFEGADRVYLELDAQGTPIGQKRDAQGKPIAQKRHHKTDGLIFAPELPYHRGTDHNYLKWKWHDTITLDFECCRTQNPKFPHGVELKFAAECGQVDFSDNIVLGAHERHRLLGDLGSMHNLITEWEWSPECSGWVYKMPRPDKDRPNFSRTVLNTLMELAEGMDIEELEYRLSFSNPEDDDWVEALATRRKALLAERRRSVANGT